MWHHSNRFDPRIGDADTGGSRYTVRGGDTLQSIAQLIWGDAALWYKLAEANALGASSSLTEGQSLLIPAGVWRNHQNASTYIPYDAARFLNAGDPSPLFPTPGAPKKGNNKCGVFGAILRTVIAVAVAIINPLQAIPVIGPAISSTISQGISVGLGLQRRFDFKQVAYAGITDAVDRLNPLRGIPVVGAAVTNAATQGIGVAVGLQKKFSWTGVAAAGVIDEVTKLVGRSLDHGGLARVFKGSGINTATDSFANNLISGTAGAIAGAATRSLIQGTDFGDNLIAVLPDVIGQTVGRAVGRAILNGGPRRSGGGRGNDRVGATQSTESAPQASSAATPPSDGSEIVVTARPYVPAPILYTNYLPDITSQLTMMNLRLAVARERGKNKAFNRQFESAVQTRVKALADDLASGNRLNPAKVGSDNKPYLPTQSGSFAIDYRTLEAWRSGYLAKFEANPGRFSIEGRDQFLASIENNRRLIGEWNDIASAQTTRDFGAMFLIGPVGGGLLAGGGALLPYAPAAANLGRTGLIVAGNTSRSAFIGLGYSGSGATIATSAAIKGAVGVGFEVAGNGLVGEKMTFGKGLGAASAAIIFGPGAEKLVGLSAATPWGFKTAGKFAVSGSFAGFGGNLVQQTADLSAGVPFSFNDLVASFFWGGALGPLAGGIQRIYTPSFFKTTGNSLIEDLFGVPKTVTEGLGGVVQKTATQSKRGQ